MEEEIKETKEEELEVNDPYANVCTSCEG